MDESNFNVTNKINFVKNGAGYEIEYNIRPKGFGYFQNLGPQFEKRIIPDAFFKRTAAPSRLRELSVNFTNIGKQNLKV